MVTSKSQLNPRKNHPRTRSSSQVSGSRLAPCGLSSKAHKAGLSVSELNALMSVEAAMVRANCR
jgi:hypothetical protein